MKVKCINIYNDYIKKYENQSDDLTIGKEYIILEIMISFKSGISYRLVGDNSDEMPAIYEASQFKIVSELIPSNWGITVFNKSIIILGPTVWQKEDFWDSSYDLDPEALRIYKRETEIIFKEQNDF